MPIYKATDETGAFSVHKAKNEEIAIQAHLLHFGLLYIKEPKIEEVGGSDYCTEEHCLKYIDELENEI